MIRCVNVKNRIFFVLISKTCHYLIIGQMRVFLSLYVCYVVAFIFRSCRWGKCEILVNKLL